MKNIRTYTIHILQGMLMGLAEIVPSVSGSALALMLGFYERMIGVFDSGVEVLLTILKWLRGKASFADVWKEVKQVEWSFGLSLAAGFLLSVVLLSHAINAVYEQAPEYMQALFFGVIAASIWTTAGTLQRRDSRTLSLAVASAVTVFFLIGLQPGGQQSDPSLVAIFFASLLAVAGMVLPGVSGGYILVVLGLYEYLVRAIKDFTIFAATEKQVLTLVIFGVGIVMGFLVAIRGIKVAFSKYKDETLAIMLGLMLGSLRGLWPFFSVIDLHTGSTTPAWPWDVQNGLAIGVIALVGFLAIVGIARFANRKTG